MPSPFVKYTVFSDVTVCDVTVCHAALSFVIAVALPFSAAISPHNNTSATPELPSEYVKVTLAATEEYADCLNVTAPLLGSTVSTPKAFE